MKKTFPVNINGKVFYIDEDAYELLLNYLDQLHSVFSDADGDEIVRDIESRISELFDEKIASGANAIVYADVNNVIGIMGKPSEINESGGSQQSESAGQTPEDAEHDNFPKSDSHVTEETSKVLYRNLDDCVFGGVIGGVATYLGWNSNIMRILVIIITFCTYFWPCCIIYLVAWMVIPPANTPRRVLEMQGIPKTVDSVGRTILSATPPPYVASKIENRGFIGSIFSALGKCVIGLLGLIGSVGALVATGFFLFFLTALIAYSAFGNLILIQNFDPGIIYYVAPSLIVTTLMLFSLCFIIPGIALAWAAVTFIFNCKSASKMIIIIAAVLEMLLIVSTIILAIFSHNMAVANNI